MEVTHPAATTLLVGAGYLGRRIAERLRAAALYLTTRTEESAAALRKRGFNVRLLDLTKSSDVSSLPAATHLILCPAPCSSRPEDRTALWELGLPQFLRDYRRRHAPRVLYTSSTGVYGDADGGWVDETTPVSTDTPRRAALVAAERAVLDAGETVLRLAGLYGPGRHRLSQVRAGRILRSEADRWANVVHVEDAAAMAVHLLNREAAGQIFLGVDTEPIRRLKMYSWIASEWGWPAPTVVPDESHDKGSDKRCSSARLQDTGFAFRYPTFREGYGQIRRTEGGEDSTGDPTTEPEIYGNRADSDRG